MVPITAIFLPQISDNRGIKVAEKLQPIKKAIPMKAIVPFEAPTDSMKEYYTQALAK